MSNRTSTSSSRLITPPPTRSTLFPYTTLFRSYDVYPLDGRHDGGYYTVKDCVTIDVLPRTPGNNVYVGIITTIIDRKSGSAGMPRPISYAVFCLKKKKLMRVLLVLV